MEGKMKKSIVLIMILAVSISFTGCFAQSTSSSKSVSVSAEKVNEAAVSNNNNNSNSNNNNNSDNRAAINNDSSSNSNTNSTTNNATVNTNKTAAETTANAAANATANTGTTPAPVAPKTTAGNKVIVIDPGHANRSNLEKEPTAPGSSQMKIKDGGGAEGVLTKTSEQSINLNVALKLKDLLQSRGYTVVMTKTREDQSLGNVERAQVGNNANAALVIRIHADSSEYSSAKGASMLVPAPVNENTKAIYAASKSYGTTILNTLVKEAGMYNRGVIESSDMTGFNWSKVPVVLVEMGFLSNTEEDKLLASQAYQDKLTKGLADGISEAIK